MMTAGAALMAVAAVALSSLAGCGCRTVPAGRPDALLAALQMMARDAEYRDVLSERVTLSEDAAAAAPSWAVGDGPALDAADVDPLAALLRLVPGDTAHRSGRDLALVADVLGAALRCVTYKRAAVHVALTARIVALGADDAAVATRAAVLAHVLPRAMDALCAAGAPYDELSELYKRALKHGAAERFVRDEYARGLDESAAALNAAVASACRVANMRDYVRGLGLAGPDGEPVTADAITEDQRVADAVALDAVAHVLRANENAVLDAYDRVGGVLSAADMSVWKTLLGYPELPEDPRDFARTVRPSYREQVVKALDKGDRPAARAGSWASVRAASGAYAMAERAHDDNPIPLMAG